ncbi:MAG TPA: nitroreductase family deazaflavin-dependent oxidoreductase [Candidatus Dormibacteraeota bacterium]|nr:nitroreductase family deazaflavin-dependent oxidoreductase [Candidatus Dormibacteraeota bacterium]
MTALSFLRPYTTRFFNPVSRRFAGHLPGFAILVYVGRRSGRTYRTPINVFRHGDDYVFALTYGSDVQWVKNVLAAGGGQLETMGRKVRLIDPQLFVDPRQRLIPLPVRLFLRLMHVTEFLSMRPAPAG